MNLACVHPWTFPIPQGVVALDSITVTEPPDATREARGTSPRTIGPTLLREHWQEAEGSRFLVRALVCRVRIGPSLLVRSFAPA